MGANKELQVIPDSELTPDQAETADFFLEICGLEAVAGQTIEMEGQLGSVRYGLGRCATHFSESTPKEIHTIVSKKLAMQGHVS